VTINANGQVIAFRPGLGPNIIPPSASNGLMGISGIHVPVVVDGHGDLTLDTSVTLRGSREISILPLGRRTTTHIESAWANPSFFGSFLPTSREVGDKGFKASWVIPYLARGFGQSFTDASASLSGITGSAFGVRFYQPVDHYQLVGRSLKYAILFVALAFLTFFVIETVSLQRLHAVQYTLVGSAQVLFYLLLLSLSEHVGFAWAYLTGAVATIGLTTLYAWAAFKSPLRAGILGAILTALYGLLYVILNAEDYALLIGALVLFAALAATMYVTRRIDWYRLAEGMIP